MLVIFTMVCLNFVAVRQLYIATSQSVKCQHLYSFCKKVWNWHFEWRTRNFKLVLILYLCQYFILNHWVKMHKILLNWILHQGEEHHLFLFLTSLFFFFLLLFENWYLMSSKSGKCKTVLLCWSFPQMYIAACKLPMLTQKGKL